MMEINSGRLFPWHFQLVALFLVALGAGLFTTNFIAAIVLVIISLLIITGTSGFQIDHTLKKYREFNAFLFVRFGSWQSYQAVDTIFINSGKSTQRVYSAHTTQSISFVDREFNGYLKFSDGEKVCVLTTKNKKKLSKKLDTLARYLGVEVADYT
jgi:hypothetical protein